MRFGCLSVHPILGHIDGLIERDFGGLVVLGILDIAVFNEFLTGIHSFGQCGQQFTASQRQCFVLVKLVDQFVRLVERLLQFLLQIHPTIPMAEEPFARNVEQLPR